jgi:sensor histidine kinase YesM
MDKSLLDFLFEENTEPVTNWLGKVGAWTSHLFIYRWFGISSFAFSFVIFIIGFFISILNTLFYWLIERYLIIVLRKRVPLASDYKKRLALEGAIVLICTLLLSLITEYPLFCLEKIPGVPIVPLFSKFMGSLIITIIIITMYEAIYNFQLFKQSLIKNEELQRINVQAQLDSLKNQVNPHFLFNSLNTLISVIPEDPVIAVKFAENLSSVYRYILEIREKELISLEDELACVKAYQYLLSIRFGNQIKFDLAGLETNQGLYVVPLSIQMLIENAVKHNVVSQARPLTISISNADGMLVICNNLQLKSQPTDSTGMGLDNIKKRYQLLANREIKVKKTTDLFCVHLPLLHLKEVR